MNGYVVSVLSQKGEEKNKEVLMWKIFRSRRDQEREWMRGECRKPEGREGEGAEV